MRRFSCRGADIRTKQRHFHPMAEAAGNRSDPAGGICQDRYDPVLFLVFSAIPGEDEQDCGSRGGGGVVCSFLMLSTYCSPVINAIVLYFLSFKDIFTAIIY